MTPTAIPVEVLARAAAADVYTMGRVNGAAEWIRTGDPSHLARPFRERMVVATERIARWMPGASSGPLALPVGTST